MYQSKDRIGMGLRSIDENMKPINNIKNRSQKFQEIENNQNHSNMISNIYNMNRNSFFLQQQDKSKSIFETKNDSSKRIQSIFKKTNQNINIQPQQKIQQQKSHPQQQLHPQQQINPQQSAQHQQQTQIQEKQQFHKNISQSNLSLQSQPQPIFHPHSQPSLQNPFLDYRSFQQNNTIFGQKLCQKPPGQKLRQLFRQEQKQKKYKKYKELAQTNFKKTQQQFMSSYDQNITTQIFYQNLQLCYVVEDAITQKGMKKQQKKQFISPFCKSYKQKTTQWSKYQQRLQNYQDYQKSLSQKRTQINLIIQKSKLIKRSDLIQKNRFKKQPKSIKRKISFDTQIKQQDQYIIYSNSNSNQNIPTIKNSSSQNNPIYSSYISKHHKQSEHIQTPISQFKISRSQRPITYQYTISFQSYDFIGQKNMKNILKQYKLKQKYQGEIKFQKFVDYQSVRNALQKQVVQKYTEIVEAYDKYTKQRYYQPQIHLKLIQFNRGSSLVTSECEGKFMLPLILKLSKGFNYCYDEYDGKIVKNLIIFNQYAQILFLNDVNLGKQSKNRDLKNKIIITQTGIHIKSQVFNHSTIKVTFFRKFKLYTDEQINFIKQTCSIIPLQIDPHFLNKQVDFIYPYRLFGYYQNIIIVEQQVKYQQNGQMETFQQKITQMIQQLIDLMVKAGEGTLCFVAKLFGMK